MGLVFVCSSGYLTFFVFFRGGRVLRSFWVLLSRCVYVRCTFPLLACSFLSLYVFSRCTDHGENREGGVASSPLNMRGLSGAMKLLLTGRDTASEIRWVVPSPLCQVGSG
jgi:hypothetical protein